MCSLLNVCQVLDDSCRVRFLLFQKHQQFLQSESVFKSYFYYVISVGKINICSIFAHSEG